MLKCFPHSVARQRCGDNAHPQTWLESLVLGLLLKFIGDCPVTYMQFTDGFWSLFWNLESGCENMLELMYSSLTHSANVRGDQTLENSENSENLKLE